MEAAYLHGVIAACMEYLVPMSKLPGWSDEDGLTVRRRCFFSGCSVRKVTC